MDRWVSWMQDWAAKGSQLTQPRPCPPRQDAALHTDASHKATVCTKQTAGASNTRHCQSSRGCCPRNDRREVPMGTHSSTPTPPGGWKQSLVDGGCWPLLRQSQFGQKGCSGSPPCYRHNGGCMTRCCARSCAMWPLAPQKHDCSAQTCNNSQHSSQHSTSTAHRHKRAWEV